MANLDFTGPGNRHFWKSDIMVQHGKGFLSVSTGTLKKNFMPQKELNNRKPEEVMAALGLYKIL